MLTDISYIKQYYTTSEIVSYELALNLSTVHCYPKPSILLILS